MATPHHENLEHITFINVVTSQGNPLGMLKHTAEVHQSVFWYHGSYSATASRGFLMMVSLRDRCCMACIFPVIRLVLVVPCLLPGHLVAQLSACQRIYVGACATPAAPAHTVYDTGTTFPASPQNRLLSLVTPCQLKYDLSKHASAYLPASSVPGMLPCALALVALFLFFVGWSHTARNIVQTEPFGLPT